MEHQKVLIVTNQLEESYKPPIVCLICTNDHVTKITTISQAAATYQSTGPKLRISLEDWPVAKELLLQPIVQSKVVLSESKIS